MNLLAVDVAKEELVVFDSERVFTIANKPRAMRDLLAKYPGWALALEPTSTYHMELAERAHRQNRTVFLVNPRDFKHFRQSRSFRAKTDSIDARCLHDYVLAHQDKLRPWMPLAPELRKLKSAIRRWFHLSRTRSKLAQVCQGDSGPELDALFESYSIALTAIEKEAIELAKLVDADCYKRVLGAPGVGPYSACCLTFLLRSRSFESPDAIRAFVGLDLRVEDSGKRTGKRFLTKRGDRMLRHGLTCAGRGLLNSKYGKKANEDLKLLGRHTPERLVIAARKVIRTVFALDQQKNTFDPRFFSWRVDMKT